MTQDTAGAEPTQTDPEPDAAPPTPADPAEHLPGWVAEIVDEIKHLGKSLDALLTSHHEHHDRFNKLIGDLRKAGIPLETIAEHYGRFGAELPPATPHGEATEPEAIPGVPSA
jgi:hypothetical protein